MGLKQVFLVIKNISRNSLYPDPLVEHLLKSIYDPFQCPLYYCCLTPYDASFTGVHILFDKENVQETLGEVVSKAGKNQLRIAETEKYAHVTFFFNGGAESLFENEDRILVNSPKVATYDLQPEMSAPEVTEKLVEAINTGRNDLIILNFATCSCSNAALMASIEARSPDSVKSPVTTTNSISGFWLISAIERCKSSIGRGLLVLICVSVSNAKDNNNMERI